MTFLHPSNRVPKQTDHATKFVYDGMLTSNLKGIEEYDGENDPHYQGKREPMTSVMTKNTQLWSDYLWTSGGILNFNKCFWYLLIPTWTGKQ